MRHTIQLWPWHLVIGLTVFFSLCQGQVPCFLQGSRLQTAEVCGPWKARLIQNREKLAAVPCNTARNIVQNLEQPNQVCCEAAYQFVTDNCLCDPVTASAVIVAGFNTQELYTAGLRWFQYSCAAYGAANAQNPCRNIAGCLS